MTITAANIKLIESERMLDTTDGGGRRTANVIPDGVAGNIFPKVSRLDAVYGRVNLRKVFGTVDTSNVDTYAGAHAIITDPPDNARISCCLFSTGSDFDQRTAARDRIESYVVAGPESRMRLYGRPPVGARAILAFQRVEETLPDIGDVFALTQEDLAGNQLQIQYIRIDTLTHEVRTFEDDRGLYSVRVITVGITSPLTGSFVGPDTPPRLSAGTRLGKIRTASAADTARYFGTQALSEAVLSGALTVRVPSVYTAIVPTTQREAAISLAEIGGATGFIGAGGSFSRDAEFGASGSGFLHAFPSGVLPSTVLFNNSSAGWPAQDDGAGNVSFTGLTSISGIADYDTGQITFTGLTGAAGGVTASALHAVGVSQPTHTRQEAVTLATRGSLYSVVLSPLPAAGTLVVDYRALGKWYRLRDTLRNGTIAGDDTAYGAGTVDYVTGGAVVTLGALPDVDSAVLFSWGSQAHFVVRAGVTSDADARLKQVIALTRKALANQDIIVTATYAASNSSVTLAGGSLTGANANFSVVADRIEGVLTLTYLAGLPDRDSSIGITYASMGSASDPVTERPYTFTSGTSIASLDFTAPLTAGTVRVDLPASVNLQATSNPAFSSIRGGYIRCKDDGAGTLVTLASVLNATPGYWSFGEYQSSGPIMGAAKIEASQVIGSINYSTGIITINSSAVEATGNVWQTPLGLRPGTWLAAGGAPAAKAGYWGLSAAVSSRNSGATSTDTPRDEIYTFEQAPLVFDLSATTGQPVVDGSVLFRIGPVDGLSGAFSSNQYVDRNGVLYRNIIGSTGVGTACGTVNYITGRVTITDWPVDNLAATIAVQSCVTSVGAFTADQVYFRTSGSPVRPSSTYVQISAEDGTQISGTSNTSGVITGALMEGTVEQEMGIVSVRFGEWMPVTGNTGQPWYDAALIDPDDSSRVWKPTRALPATLRYSAIVTSNVSLDPAILGLDPVRLPLDGRVPIYRPADVVVLHNTQSVTLTNPVSAGATYTVGRTGLSDLWLVSAAGVRVDPAQYTVDLADGSVTMANPLTLTGVTQPLVAKHRVEDMLLLADVQIDGTLTSAGPVSRNYDTAGTYVSSALLFGDLSARVSNVFDQGTWTAVWSDALIGDGATAQYNDVLYPLEVTNAGAVAERWRIQFTSSTAFQCIGQNSGVIATGTTSADFGPVNPLTLLPYFVIRSGGWGSGWSVGNQLRFNTVAAAAPIWMARTVLPGASLAGDSISVQVRGDVDA